MSLSPNCFALWGKATGRLCKSWSGIYFIGTTK